MVDDVNRVAEDNYDPAAEAKKEAARQRRVERFLSHMSRIRQDKDHICTGCLKGYKEGLASQMPCRCNLTYTVQSREAWEAGQYDNMSEEQVGFAHSLTNPVTWAANVLKWEARWYQKEILLCSSRQKVVRAGRRCGKTDALIVDILWKMYKGSDEQKRNRRILVICPYQFQVDALFTRTRELIAKSTLLETMVESDKRDPQYIKFNNEAELLGFTASVKTGGKANKIRGQGATDIYFDEVDYLDDGSIESVMAILVDNPDVHIWASSTPTGKRQSFYRWCFPPGTPILTHSGYLPIEHLSVDDEVLDCVGGPDLVSKTFTRQFDGELVDLSFHKTYRTLASTPEHPHLVKRGNGYPKFREAKEVRVDDWVAVTIPRTAEVGRLPYPPIPTFAGRHKDINSQTGMKAFLKNGYMGLPDKRSVDAYLEACDVIDQVNSDPEVRADFFKILGVYLAEGNTVKSKKWMNPSVQTAHRLSEPIEVRLNSRAAALLVSFFCGDGAANKKIHSALFDFPEIDLLVEAYFRGDGHTDTSGCWTAATISENLADQLWRYWLAKGKVCTVSRSEKKDRRTAYTVRVQKSGSDKIIWVEGVPFIRVRDVSTKPYSGPVHNIETCRTHTYSANGFGTHNCTDKNLGYKEWHYTSRVSPVWDDEMEIFLRSIYTIAGFQREFLAEFGESDTAIFKPKYVEASLVEYKYSDSPQPRPDCYYTMGVDWNSTGSGVHIIILEYSKLNGKFRVADKHIVQAAEFTQHHAVDWIVKLNNHWNPLDIYVDAGFGEMQIAELKKIGMKYPATGLHRKVKGIAMNSNTEVRDPVNKVREKQHTKSLMVELCARQVELLHCILPRAEDSADGGFSGLVRQMRNFEVERYAENGRPIYTNTGEDTLTAWMLALFAFLIEHTDITNVDHSVNVNFSGSLGVDNRNSEAIEKSAPEQIDLAQLTPRSRSIPTRTDVFGSGTLEGVKAQQRRTRIDDKIRSRLMKEHGKVVRPPHPHRRRSF